MTRLPFDVILFDIDNVLIDTRASYLTAIQKTVETYLRRPGVVSLKDVDEFKLLGGFNDDWDCSFGIVTFLETAIQGKPIRFGDHRRQRLALSELRNLFPERPLGIEGLLKNLQTLYERVETPSYKKIAKIFQGVYWKNPGLVKKEKLIFPRSFLKKIRDQGIRLGVVTGRNRLEARYALKRFGILSFFDAVVTIDDVKKEEKRTGGLRRKPDPWSVLEAARRIAKGQGTLRYLYVGDLPDDILAATRAKKAIRIHSAAFPKFARDLEATLSELKKVEPDFLLKNPKDLLKILSL